MKSLAAVIALAALRMGAGAASSGRQAERISVSAQEANPPYDGRFAFVRLRYGADRGDIRGDLLYGRFGRGGREPMWSHDAPRAEHNFLRIMEEVTSVWTSPDSRLILSADDHDLFRHPVAYIAEPGVLVPHRERGPGPPGPGFSRAGSSSWMTSGASIGSTSRPRCVASCPRPNSWCWRAKRKSSTRSSIPEPPSDGDRELQQRHR